MVEMSAALKKFQASERETETLPSGAVKATDYDLTCNGSSCTLQVTETTYVTSSRLWAHLGLADKLWRPITFYVIFEKKGKIAGQLFRPSDVSPIRVEVTRQNAWGMAYLDGFSNALLAMERAGETSDQLSTLREFIDDLP